MQNRLSRGFIGPWCVNSLKIDHPRVAIGPIIATNVPDLGIRAGSGETSGTTNKGVFS